MGCVHSGEVVELWTTPPSSPTDATTAVADTRPPSVRAAEAAETTETVEVRNDVASAATTSDAHHRISRRDECGRDDVTPPSDPNSIHDVPEKVPLDSSMRNKTSVRDGATRNSAIREIVWARDEHPQNKVLSDVGLISQSYATTTTPETVLDDDATGPKDMALMGDVLTPNDKPKAEMAVPDVTTTMANEEFCKGAEANFVLQTEAKATSEDEWPKEEEAFDNSAEPDEARSRVESKQESVAITDDKPEVSARPTTTESITAALTGEFASEESLKVPNELGFPVHVKENADLTDDLTSFEAVLDESFEFEDFTEYNKIETSGSSIKKEPNAAPIVAGPSSNEVKDESPSDLKEESNTASGEEGASGEAIDQVKEVDGAGLGEHRRNEIPVADVAFPLENAVLGGFLKSGDVTPDNENEFESSLMEKESISIPIVSSKDSAAVGDQFSHEETSCNFEKALNAAPSDKSANQASPDRPNEVEGARIDNQNFHENFSADAGFLNQKTIIGKVLLARDVTPENETERSESSIKYEANTDASVELTNVTDGSTVLGNAVPDKAFAGSQITEDYPEDEITERETPLDLTVESGETTLDREVEVPYSSPEKDANATLEGLASIAQPTKYDGGVLHRKSCETNASADLKPLDEKAFLRDVSKSGQAMLDDENETGTSGSFPMKESNAASDADIKRKDSQEQQPEPEEIDFDLKAPNSELFIREDNSAAKNQVFDDDIPLNRTGASGVATIDNGIEVSNSFYEKSQNEYHKNELTKEESLDRNAEIQGAGLSKEKSEENTTNDDQISSIEVVLHGALDVGDDATYNGIEAFSSLMEKNSCAEPFDQPKAEPGETETVEEAGASFDTTTTGENAGAKLFNELTVIDEGVESGDATPVSENKATGSSLDTDNGVDDGFFENHSGSECERSNAYHRHEPVTMKISVQEMSEQREHVKKHVTPNKSQVAIDDEIKDDEMANCSTEFTQSELTSNFKHDQFTRRDEATAVAALTGSPGNDASIPEETADLQQNQVIPNDNPALATASSTLVNESYAVPVIDLTSEDPQDQQTEFEELDFDLKASNADCPVREDIAAADKQVSHDETPFDLLVESGDATIDNEIEASYSLFKEVPDAGHNNEFTTKKSLQHNTEIQGAGLDKKRAKRMLPMSTHCQH